MRGLKQQIRIGIFIEKQVASFTDAWIETANWNQHEIRVWSHLLQMRGLKQNQLYKHYHPHRRIFYRCVD